ncbi:crotonase/enoyl-CoA hydratase family protein [Mycobacteroides abscessus subsp. abscessus]|uniref:crotonase/enoyl-CoA hydratase family protein n=1 Tax=Mycobacteroides abscessus TaxID=36809 RepID=UPI0004683359|nr:crotonase/enoyl-CoA hydratase family protein [Mycobacteroides abscessus]MBN7532692.1 crotonase/enoyl-CoA hydratase family protein [Mycobacteroides abscessus subsp. abscessus]
MADSLHASGSSVSDSLHASGSSVSDSLHASGSSADGWKAFTVETTGHIAQVTLIGPGKGNAMGPDFWRELPLIFAELDADPEVRAVVLAAAGRHFSYGLDLPAMAGTFMPLMAEKALAKPRTDFLDEIRRLQASVTAVADCRKPVIAAIQGWCIGGGVDLIAAADIRYASSEAKFSVREAKVAIVADIGSLHRLPPIIGDGHLRELAFTGKDIDAARAEKIGLVNDVFDTPEATLAAAHATAAEIAANPPLVVQGVKDVLGRERENVVADGLKYVSTWNAAFLPSEDLQEAIGAVFEKREPDFKGR